MVSQNKKFQYTIISLEFTKMDGENQNSSDKLIQLTLANVIFIILLTMYNNS